MRSAPVVLLALILAACGSGKDGGRPARPTGCSSLGVLPDEPNLFELQWGVTNTNASLGQGALTATLSKCGEVTSLKWPGPSYYDQLDYLADNAEDARLKPRFGALEGAGAFAGIVYETAAGRGFTWLRDDEWTHEQRYASESTDVVVTRTTHRDLGLAVDTTQLISRGVLVNHFAVQRMPASPVTGATLIFYANFAPTLTRLAYFHLGDWALDFQNDYAALYDSRERAILHFLPESARSYPHDFTPLNPILRAPPADSQNLQARVDGVIEGLDEPGVYIAFGAREGDDGFQCGFDENDLCRFQSLLAERTIAVFELTETFAELARTLFQCTRVIPHPGGPLGACREANGWTYNATSAYEDAADGVLSGSPIAACQANVALAKHLRFDASGKAEATFDVAVAGSRDDAYALLRQTRSAGTSPQVQIAEVNTWWHDFLSRARLPRTDDPDVLAFARRSLIVIRQATDNASGAIVASVNAQPPYGSDWPRDGAFINYALDLAGYTDIVSRHNYFYARVQRKGPGSWSVLYDFPPCNPAAPVYPNCIPAGTFEQNYYADPDEAVPALPVSFEIDEAALGVWTMWDHARFIADPVERSAYLARVCPSIQLGAENLAACKDETNNLQCSANEDDNIPLAQTLQGAETVLLALKSAIAAAADCGFTPEDASAWQARAEELEQAIRDNFYVADPIPHFRGPRMPWLIWPVGFFSPDDPLALSHAEVLRREGIEPILQRTAPSGAYNAEPLLVLAQLARTRGDAAALAELQEVVRFFIRNLTTHDTGLMSEAYGRVPLDLNGDGTAPDYWPQNDVPHVWEHAYLYSAAMIAFGADP